MPMPSASRATSAPMPPKPIRPSVLPVSCVPSLRSHWPPRIAPSMRAKPRAAAKSRPTAHSATAVSP